MMNDKQQREADAQRAQQQQQQTGPSSSTAGGHDGYSSAAGSAPPPKAPPSKARPSTPPARKDWVIPRVPNGYLFRTSSMPDQRNSEFITSAWMDERDHFLLSIVQGPAAQAASTLGSAPWAQYLRRVTAYACMIFGVCNPGVVTEDTASTISEKDWLRCYSHIVRKLHADADRMLFVDSRYAHDARASRRERRQPVRPWPHQEDDHQPTCLQDHRSTKRSKRS